MSAPLRYSAFTDDPAGGNPAGVVLDADELDDDGMLAIAAELGYSESAFVRPREGNEYDIRFFSPLAEVAFCGHATIATGVALAERNGPGRIVFHTREGEVPVDTSVESAGVTATLTSVAPYVEEPPDTLLEPALQALGYASPDLDPQLPPKVAYAGVRHLIIGVATRERLARLEYDFEGLQRLMLNHDLTTVDLIFREDATTFQSRNPFPVGGVVEDPATGAAAAALGAYLRELGLVTPPATVTIHQGVDMGRPSLLTVDIGDEPQLRVTGRAVTIPS
jgi:PhzF family phenazine biosynthesis protein